MWNVEFFGVAAANSTTDTEAVLVTKLNSQAR
jgi:hypothetical protein